MSQPIEENGDVTQGQDASPVEDNGTSNDGGTTDTGGHPAWKEILDQLPDEFHPLITPKLEAWDSGVQTRFQSLQSKYEPFNFLLEAEVDPDYVNQALGLSVALEQDPERVYKALAEAYGYGQGATDTNAIDEDTDDTDPDDPIMARLAEQERMLERMAETFLADQSAKEEQEYASALDGYMKALHQVYDESGGFDDDYILTKLANGADGEEAVKEFQQKYVSKTAAPPRAPAPPVMGSGGGMPSNQVDPRNLSDADTRNMVAELLKAANEET